MANRKKGFTLVELLIVIVVIGVLSAMMMLSSTEAVSSAKAADIVSNLRNWKTATLEWYTDNLDKVTPQGKVKDDNGNEQEFTKQVHAKDILPYLGSGLKVDGNDVKDSSGGRYFTDYANHGTNSREWLIGYQLPVDDARVKEKLEARAETTGLLWKQGTQTGSYTATHANNVSAPAVFISIIDFTKDLPNRQQ